LTLAKPDLLMEPWDHDFTVIGFKTLQREAVFPSNQPAKQPVLGSLIESAPERLRRRLQARFSSPSDIC
jgi:hypothetical protein